MPLARTQGSGVTRIYTHTTTGCMHIHPVTCWAGAQTALRKKLEDAKTERDRSQNSDDVRALRDEISELR